MKVFVSLLPLPQLMAEVTTSVSMVEHHLQEGGHGQWLSEMGPIFLIAILEFLACRLLELASSEAQRRDTQRLITLELLVVTVHNDTLPGQLFSSPPSPRWPRLIAVVVVVVLASY